MLKRTEVFTRILCYDHKSIGLKWPITLNGLLDAEYDNCICRL